MLKLSATYSKKMPVQGQEFSSQGYQATIEVELPTGLKEGDLQKHIQQTFALVRDSVECELRNHRVGPPQPLHPQLAPTTKVADSAPGASDKQLRFLRTLAARRGMNPTQLDAYVHQLHGVEAAGALTRKQASDLISALNTARAA